MEIDLIKKKCCDGEGVNLSNIQNIYSCNQTVYHNS